MLLPALDAFPEERELHKAARQLLYENSGVTVCQAALGEALSVLSERLKVADFDTVMTRLYKHIEARRITVYGNGPHNCETLDLASKLHFDEPNLKPTDALIIAAACTDKALELVTMDEFAEWETVRNWTDIHHVKIRGFGG